MPSVRSPLLAALVVLAVQAVNGVPLEARQDDVLVITVTEYFTPSPTVLQVLATPNPVSTTRFSTHSALPSAVAKLATWTPAQGKCEAVNSDFSSPPIQCGVSWLDTINQFRIAYGRTALVWNPLAAQQSLKNAGINIAATQPGGGITQLHRGGGFSEVITPGFTVPPVDADMKGLTPFAAALVGWFCEFPKDPQLQASGFTGIDLCGYIGPRVIWIHMDYVDPKLNHHDILLQKDIKGIGCAYLGRTSPPENDRWTGQYICNMK